MSKSIRAEKRRCTPELIVQYPDICSEGIRQVELIPAKHICGVEHVYDVTGHFHYTVDAFTFVSGEK